MSSNSNRNTKARKTAAKSATLADSPNRKRFVPPKPKDSPLTPHSGGKWMKKINGKLEYFGRWGKLVNGEMVRLPGDGHKQAVEELEARLEEIKDGGKPQAADAGLTIRKLCDDYLVSKKHLLDTGEITPRTFAEYKATAERVFNFFGRNKLVDEITQADFERLRASIAKNWGPVRLSNEVVRVRGIFIYNKKEHLVPDTFKKASAKTLRKHRAASAKKLFTNTEILQLLDGKPGDTDNDAVRGASIPLRAMILLALNCGFGNGDMGELPKTAVDLDTGWVDFPRPKTGVGRRCPLWPETVSALRAALAVRPTAKKADARNCFFVTEFGHRYVRLNTTSTTTDGEEVAKYVPIDSIGLEFGKLLQRLKINGRKGLGFYSLRHTFATVALQTGDRDCVKALMGHVESDILSGYDETGPSDERRQAVVNHVRTWLFGKGGAK